MDLLNNSSININEKKYYLMRLKIDKKLINIIIRFIYIY